MKKFFRMNKHTQVREEFLGLQGVLNTIDNQSRPNKVSQKKYFRFTAKVDTPKGEMLIGGQVYEELIPFLGAMPKVGDRLDFNCKLTDLQAEKTNTRWNISGAAVDSVDDLLSQIDEL